MEKSSEKNMAGACSSACASPSPCDPAGLAGPARTMGWWWWGGCEDAGCTRWGQLVTRCWTVACMGGRGEWVGQSDEVRRGRAQPQPSPKGRGARKSKGR